MKFFTSNFSYDYPFPTVTLAYFLRYPNPYSTHVLATDILARRLDPATGRLHTTRLHLKQSKLPAAVLRLLPKNILGRSKGPDGEARNFVLERSVIDLREGWMETETRNLQFTGVLSVVERQRFARPHPPDPVIAAAAPDLSTLAATPDTTDVATTVTFRSRFGQRGADRRRATDDDAADDEAGPKRGLFATWSTGALQRTIESTGLQRTRQALGKSKQGMTVVLERMRAGGLAAAVEGMRRDRELVVGGGGSPVVERVDES